MTDKEEWLNANSKAIEDKFHEIYDTIELKNGDPLHFYRVWENFLNMEFDAFTIEEVGKYEKQ